MNSAAPIADAVLVTGAGRRVGLHLAERMLDRQRLVIAHFHAETAGVEVLRRRGALCVAADLATESGTLDLIRAVQASAISLRAVAYNASAFERTAPEVEDALRHMDRFCGVHMRAPFALNASLASLLAQCSERRADIVRITDIYADDPNPLVHACCATKAGRH